MTSALGVDPFELAPRSQPSDVPDFEQVYERHFDFVWRSLRRLGVPAENLDDAAQEVFLVVHRRLESFEGRSSLTTWLFGIALRVARGVQRSAARREAEPLPELLADLSQARPDDSTLKAEAARLVHEILDQLDEDRRVVFVLAELEQLSAPEISEMLGVNLNTIYWRLRTARQQFEAALKRRRARENWRQP